MVEGETQLAEDFKLFLQKCHTKGLIGYELQLEDGQNIIFCGDTIYTEQAYKESLPPGGSINKSPEEFYENLAFIREMQKKEKAIIFFGHDYEQAKDWEEKGWICSASQIK
ncbi:MAG: hypothetical protein VB082_05095 [Christensenella sp.]|nr:hypothetical protein [Christensenella sp.]